MNLFSRFALFWAILFTLTLSGCVTNPPQVQLVTTETLTLVEPDPQYLGDCYAEPAIDPFTYATMGVDEREDALTRLTISLYGNLKSCTNDKIRLRALIEKQKGIVDEHNAKAKARADELMKQKGGG